MRSSFRDGHLLKLLIHTGSSGLSQGVNSLYVLFSDTEPVGEHPPVESDELELGNERIAVSFDKNGMLAKIRNKHSGVEVNIDQAFVLYYSHMVS